MGHTDLEDLSFKNMVEFHQEELNRILQGEKARSCFSSERSVRLAKLGILDQAGSGYGSGSIYVVSERARVILRWIANG